MANVYLKTQNQTDAYSSPWSRMESIKVRLWQVTWTLLVSWLPKIFSKWHLFLLKLFGAKIVGNPFIAPSARIYAPWLLEVHHKACLGDRCEIYDLGPVYIGDRAVVAQHAYVCNGTHDLTTPDMPLLVGNLKIDNDVFIGAKAFIMPGVHIAEYSVVGAGSVVIKDTQPYDIVGGNPAKFIKKREMYS